MQSLALQITVALLLVLAACFVFVLLNSRGVQALDAIAPSAYRLRSRLFIAVSVAGLVIIFATLTPWPHAIGATEVTRTIAANSRQWVWDLSDTNARIGETIEFHVTSEDVNHGFALYDPQMRIVAQVQAMPGFVNKVVYRFDRPGKYEVLCLEYCGLAHHGMKATIEVQPAESR